MSRAISSVETTDSRRVHRLLLPITAAYLVVVVGLMLWWHLALTPDLLLLAILPIGILSGRFSRWLADWLPFVVLLVAWQSLRGFAATAGFHAHNAPLKGDLLLFGGQIPTVLLQRLLDHRQFSDALNTVLTGVYISHFAIAVGVGLLLWLADHRVFTKYVVALLGMAMAAFLVFLVFPTAPPWFDSDHAFMPHIQRIFVDYVPSQFGPVFSRINPNEFAAFPSMHAAFPFLGYLAMREWNRKASWAMLAWCIVVWFGVVYLGEHFMVDVISGIAFAAGAWWITGWLSRHPFVVRVQEGQARRRAEPDSAPEPARS